jgi:hypothetical protein
LQPPIGNPAIYAQVNGWAGLPAANAWTLCYKATRANGNPGFIFYAAFGALQFHSKCDNRGATFFVAKTGKRRGVRRIHRRASIGECTTRTDPAAFVFSVTNGFTHEQNARTTEAASGRSIPFKCRRVGGVRYIHPPTPLSSVRG